MKQMQGMVVPATEAGGPVFPLEGLPGSTGLHTSLVEKAGG